MNIVTVKVNGIEYNLKGNEKEEYLHRVASYVDKKIKVIMDNNQKLSTSAAAVLSAMNVVDDLFKCDQAYEETLNKLESCMEKESGFIEQIELLKKQLHHMEQFNLELQGKIKSNKEDKTNVEDKTDVIEEIFLAEKEEETHKSTKEIANHKESTAQVVLENPDKLKAENKELKFQIQTFRYKVIDLQNKLIENQIDLAKYKKKNDEEISILKR